MRAAAPQQNVLPAQGWSHVSRDNVSQFYIYGINNPKTFRVVDAWCPGGLHGAPGGRHLLVAPGRGRWLALRLQQSTEREQNVLETGLHLGANTKQKRW